MKVSTLHPAFRTVLTSALFLVSAHWANALVKFNDGHDELFVTGTAGVVLDSNIFAENNSRSDTLYSESVDIDYQRKAGMLGINGNAGWKFGQFSRNTSENYTDPHLRAELTKGSGRTTGSLSAGVQRESRTENTLNLRTQSWDYNAGLNVKYPVIERYSLSAQLAYDYRDYLHNPTLFDIRTYTAGSDLYYVYTSQRDILGGYRLRITDTTNGTRSYDHAFTLGTTGKLLPKLTGTIRAGYQLRQTDRNNNGVDGTFSAFTTTTTATWTATKRITVTGIASRDFSTIATDVNIDHLYGMLNAGFATTARVTLFVGGGGGELRYIGSRSGGRHDTYVTADAGASYTLNDHFKLTVSYAWYDNWSTARVADYVRRTLSVTASSRW
jgi:hypothetical protein